MSRDPDKQHCGRCDGSGIVQLRMWDEGPMEYMVTDIRCPDCGGAGYRYWHEDQAKIDYLETRYDDLYD